MLKTENKEGLFSHLIIQSFSYYSPFYSVLQNFDYDLIFKLPKRTKNTSKYYIFIQKEDLEHNNIGNNEDIKKNFEQIKDIS